MLGAVCDGDAATRSAASIARATHTSNRISLTNGACQSIRILALLLCSTQVSSSHPTLLVPMPRTTGATGASLGADSRLHLPEEARARAEDDAEDEAERAEHPCDLRLGPGEPPRRRHHRAGRQVAVGAPQGKGQEPHGLRQGGGGEWGRRPRAVRRRRAPRDRAAAAAAGSDGCSSANEEEQRPRKHQQQPQQRRRWRLPRPSGPRLRAHPQLPLAGPGSIRQCPPPTPLQPALSPQPRPWVASPLPSRWTSSPLTRCRQPRATGTAALAGPCPRSTWAEWAAATA